MDFIPDQGSNSGPPAVGTQSLDLMDQSLAGFPILTGTVIRKRACVCVFVCVNVCLKLLHAASPLQTQDTIIKGVSVLDIQN